MKKWMLILLLVTVGCGSQEGAEEPSDDQTGSESKQFSGYVMDQNENSILVVDNIEPDGGSPIWITGVEEDMWLGKSVEVTVDGPVAESYPMQAQAGEVKVVKAKKPEGADLDESQVLASALAEVDRSNTLSVESMTYDQEQDQWIIKMRSTVTESGAEKVIVPDQNFGE
ncbi:DUF3221 domain-containing protein [Halobacillus sp. Marseille-Q1614]|uniref:DUF3221 domain-containing protein n=1 Tax=Halobacillus sp. Marseille-Q1614 TaxID=2709134 RepID=UPI001570A2F5|nr:DUF3221 domain-containing protein [Halobacillus sp. Marseille-Q1614]